MQKKVGEGWGKGQGAYGRGVGMSGGGGWLLGGGRVVVWDVGVWGMLNVHKSIVK